MKFLFFFSTTLACFLWLANTIISPQQKQIVIGIISTPGSNRTDSTSSIKTSYVEFMELGGVTVIPIPWDLDEEKFNLLLESVNGILFTGGSAFLWDEDEVTGARTFSAFQKRLNYVVNLVIQKKKKGIHYPLWAICQGFEAVSIALTGDLYILDRYVQFGKLAEIYFTLAAAESTMFQYFAKESFEFLQENPTMFYWHEYSLNTSVPSLYPELGPEKWRVTGISKDDNGKEFLAAMESVEYPIYIEMFHAERILWEANHLPKANHPSGALYATKLLSESFASEAQKNNNLFENKKLLEVLVIENFLISNLGPTGFHYVFNKNSLNDLWKMVEDKPSGYGTIFIWICLIIGIIAISGYISVRNKRKTANTDRIPLLVEDIELRQKLEF